MDKFWELLGESVIAQSAISYTLVATTCYMFAAGRDVPVLLGGMTMLVLGFYFGQKTQQALNRRMSKEK